MDTHWVEGTTDQQDSPFFAALIEQPDMRGSEQVYQ